MKLIPIFTLVLLLCSCQSTKTNSNSVNIDTIVENELGEPTSFDTSGIFTIYRIEKDNATNYPWVKYVVINNDNGAILKKGIITMGYIKWTGEATIEVLDLPGALPDGRNTDDYKEIINLNLK